MRAQLARKRLLKSRGERGAGAAVGTQQQRPQTLLLTLDRERCFVGGDGCRPRRGQAGSERGVRAALGQYIIKVIQ